MNLICLYGPPAVGKLTVANELSRLTSFPVFHNHMTRDIVRDIFQDTLKQNYKLVEILRQDVFAYCARQGQSIIFTFVYDGPTDNNVVHAVVDTIESNGGSVKFIELAAPPNVLLERVSDESRKKYKKLHDAEILQSYLNEVPFGTVPYEDVLKINTSEASPVESAQKIADHFSFV